MMLKMKKKRENYIADKKLQYPFLESINPFHQLLIRVDQRIDPTSSTAQQNVD